METATLQAVSNNSKEHLSSRSHASLIGVDSTARYMCSSDGATANSTVNQWRPFSIASACLQKHNERRN